MGSRHSSQVSRATVVGRDGVVSQQAVQHFPVIMIRSILVHPRPYDQCKKLGQRTSFHLAGQPLRLAAVHLSIVQSKLWAGGPAELAGLIWW